MADGSNTSVGEEEGAAMPKAPKRSVGKMTGHLQLIGSYLEARDRTKALVKTAEDIIELHALATSLTG
jgi:hypothetical protein